LIGKRPSAPASPTAAATAPPLTASRIVAIVGVAGEQTGEVYKITVGRDDLKMTEMGAALNARMGLNSWAAFVGSDLDAAVAGDIAMTAAEVAPVLKTLRQNGFDVVAIHHHMTSTTPTVYFLHYWKRGPVDGLASGFRAALDLIGKASR
jgi:D-arabinose 1-dehydrogenase-like Zn-dependent alcohol dehydrogenase